MDCLPYVQPVSPRGDPLDLRELFGRFANCMDRRFILVRRSVDITHDYLGRLFTQCNTPQWRHTMAAILRSTRNLRLTLWITEENQDYQNCILELERLLNNNQVQRNIKGFYLVLKGQNVLGPTIKLSPLFCLMVSQISFQSSLSPKNIPLFKCPFPRLTWIEHNTMHYDDFDALLSLGNVRSHKLFQNSWPCIQHFLNDPRVQMLDISESKLGYSFRNYLPAVSSGIWSLSITDCININSFSNLRRLSISSNMFPYHVVREAIRPLNERGQLTFLRLSQSRVDHRGIRVLLEEIGIDHPNCSLRQLEIDCYYSVTSSSFLVPVLECSRLETLVLHKKNHCVTTTNLQTIAQILLNRGLLLEFRI